VSQETKPSAAPAHPAWITLACFLAALLTLLPQLGWEGWPQNHERLSLFERAEGFRLAYAAGDWLPLWTPFCHHGHGSPWPFFYHRLFNTVSGSLAWVLGSSYRAVQVTLLLCLFTGASGTAALLRRLGARPGVQVLAALLLCLSPYTYTDWLIRGAGAEFAAMMLYPWLLWASLRLFTEGRGGWRLGLVLVLMFYAHTVMFLYAFVTVALAALFTLARQGPRAMLRGMAEAGGLVLVLCAPYALLLVRLGKHFYTEVLGIYLPEREYRPPLLYLWDTDFRWGQQWQELSPEVGPVVLAGLVVLLPVALAARGSLAGRGMALGFFGLAALPYALLQLPLATPFYQSVPFASLLQFPWRLLAFLTPLAVLALSLVVEALLARGGWRRDLALSTGVLALSGGVQLGWKAMQPQYEHMARPAIEAHLAALDRPWSSLEFLPHALPVHGVPPRSAFLRFSEGCQRAEAEPPAALQGPFHFERITLRVSSTAGCAVAFNQFDTPFLALETGEGATRLPMRDATLAVQLPAGEQSLTLRRRGFWELLWSELRRGT
jgi:hypothetical protein